MEKENDNIKKEVIDKSKLPTDKHHPGEEISNENNIIIGDAVEGEEPSPVPAPKAKPNYVLIVLVIVVAIIAIFWGIKGCNERSAQDNLGEIVPVYIENDIHLLS